LNSITSSVNQSLLGNSFGQSASSTASTSALLQAVQSQKIPDINVLLGGESQSLAGAVTASLSQADNTANLSALSQLNSYSASDSLLAGAYGLQSSSSNAVLNSAVSSQGNSNSLLQSAYPYDTTAVDELI
jgi:hypothetical protein